MVLPPSAGAVQATAAVRSPAEAVTPVGAPGAAGGVATPALNTIVAMSHVVFDPVLTSALGVVPAPVTRSSTNSCMSVNGDTLTRDVNPPPPVNALLKPEST